MYRLIFVLIAILFTSEVRAQVQTDSTSSRHRFSASVFGSTLGLVSLGNISMDHLIRAGNKRHIGYTIGFTGIVDLNGYASSGGHLTLCVLRKTNNPRRFFEFKIGIAHVPWGFDSSSWLHSMKTYPMLSIGSRKQRPDSPTFFRFALSTGGIGIGFGVNLN